MDNNIKNIGFDTLNMLNLFDLNDDDNNEDEETESDELNSLLNRNKYVLHIPHSSTNIPDESFYVLDKENFNNEIQKLTDWETDKIFDIENTTKIITDFSRLFCDVERFYDESEPMFFHGRGFFYTHTDCGKELRKIDIEYKNMVLNNFYKKHHNIFNNEVDNKLNDFGNVLIIDCHSFPNIPLNTDSIKDTNRPDFCIGIDRFHTPKILIDYLVNILKSYGFSVEINNPYKGTIIPIKHYNNSNVHSIMIEINRKLYMDNDNVIFKKVKNLNKLLNKIL